MLEHFGICDSEIFTPPNQSHWLQHVSHLSEMVRSIMPIALLTGGQSLNAGDIVIIKTTGERVTILKRILGLPGDRIRMLDGKIFINDKELNEPYIKQNGGWRERELELKPDVYWAIGDNRAISEFGKVHASMLVGKILF